MKPQQFTPKRKAGALTSVVAVLVVSLGLSALLWFGARSSLFASHGNLSPACLSLLCWALVIVGILGTALASYGGRLGWLLLFGLQPIWIAYALCTDQNGLILGSLAYGLAQLNGFLKSAKSNSEGSQLPLGVEDIGPGNLRSCLCPPAAGS